MIVIYNTCSYCCVEACLIKCVLIDSVYEPFDSVFSIWGIILAYN